MRRRGLRALAALVACFVGLVLGVAVVPQSAHGLAKIKCDTRSDTGRELDSPLVTRGQFDPIVNHNQPSSAHLHEFFGAMDWHHLGGAANYGDVVGNRTLCREVGDTAAYWAPALVYTSGPKAGQLVPVQQFTAYYRAFAGQKFGKGQAFPPDTRLVATDNEGYGLHGWTCGQASQQAQEQGGVDFIPDCTGEDGSPGNTLTAHANFPSCWDGTPPNHSADDVGDTRDNAHYVYPRSKTACPSSHPIEMVQLRETIQYDYQGDGTDVALASDHDGDRPGSSFHVDFWNTWDQDRLESIVRDCINDQSRYSGGKCDP